MFGMRLAFLKQETRQGAKLNGIVSNTYVAHYTPQGMLTTRSQQTNENNGTEKQPHASAINITLSNAAQAALAANTKNISTDIGKVAHQKLEQLLERLGRDSLLDDGKLAVDLSSLSRQEVFAASSNSGDLFTTAEQKAGKIELERRFDAALTGGVALMRVTGSYQDLYESALEYLQNAGEAEKKTTDWQAQFNALKQASTYLDTHPDTAPTGIANDPVADYLERLDAGAVSENGNLEGIAVEARKVLDRISGANGQMEGLSRFGSRTLSAIAVNVSDQFSDREIIAAKHEIKSRVGASVQSAFQQANTSGDPTNFSKRLIAQYSSMSAEEREAAGLDKSYYDAIVKNYETSQRISQTLNIGTSGVRTSSGGSLSLLNFL